MKIALFTPYDIAFPGGVNKHVFKLKENFERMGHDVEVIGPSSVPEARLNIPGVHTVSGAVPIAKGSGGSVARIGISPFIIPKVKLILDRGNFDVVHFHEPFCPAVPTYGLMISNYVNVATFHALHEKHKGYILFHPVFRPLFHKLRKKIAVSRAALKFVSYYFPGEYEIIPNGVDYEFFSRDVEPLRNFRDGKLNILFVGRLERRKGLRTLIGAFERVKSNFEDVRLIIVGPDGGLKEELEEKVSRCRIRDVEFVGYVSDEELLKYYKTCDIFCSPAEGRESFGIVLLEAMASGKPVVATNIGGYKEVMEDGRQGILVNPRDEEGLAGALLRLLRDENMRRAMGEEGRRRAKDFSWVSVSKRVLDVYREAIQSKRSFFSLR